MYAAIYCSLKLLPNNDHFTHTCEMKAVSPGETG